MYCYYVDRARNERDTDEIVAIRVHQTALIGGDHSVARVKASNMAATSIFELLKISFDVYCPCNNVGSQKS